MRLWLASKWEDIRTSFWFMPTLMVAAAVALSLATIHLDKATPRHNWVATLGWTFMRGPVGSRAVLATVAGSMMTIASVTFSITVMALQVASSQFGPRLLRNFMHDRGNQVALGTLIVPGIIDAAFHQIRQATRGDTSVTLRLLETIAALRRHTRDPVVRAALRRHADAIHRGSREGLKYPLDREDAERRHREVIEVLDGTADAPPPSGASP